MDEQEQITVKFWGVRGSHPAPGADTVFFGGNTPCVEIRIAGFTIILDAGSGIIPLGRSLARQAATSGVAPDVLLLFSHMHHDHTQGFPFFAPAFMLGARLRIFGPNTFERDLEQILAHNMIPPFFPVTLHDMGAAKDIHSLSEHQLVLIDRSGAAQILPANSPAALQTSHPVCIRALRSYAHPGGVMIYRIEWRSHAIVYATDTEGYADTDRRLAAFARGADLLIHDAQYTETHYLGQTPGLRSTQGWGHSTPAMACRLAQAAEVQRLALFHYDPTYSDADLSRMEESAQQLFPNTLAPYEGLELSLDEPVDASFPPFNDGRSSLALTIPTPPG